ncbi:MAG: chemotaxis protein CheA, partial [Planctomycetota bacterium]|nr:chemotaxis protein CheA [Planctomycetota bacterium]
MGEHDEFIGDFLEECDENLDQFDQDLVALEENPRDEEKLKSVFRNIHTVKGSSGFFGYAKIGSLAHEGESLLGKLRDGEIEFTGEIATGLLAMSDAIREILVCVEQTQLEGEKDYGELLNRLVALAESDPEGSKGAQADTTVDPHLIDNQAQIRSVEKQDKDSAETSLSVETPHEKELGEPADGIKRSGTPPLGGPDEASLGELPPLSKLSEAVSDLSSSPVPSATETKLQSSSEQSSIRVDVTLLDELMDFAGELVLARNTLNRCSDDLLDPKLSRIANRVSQVTSEIQERVTRTRMQPIGGIWTRYKRIVRDLAAECGKQVKLELKGQDTELDRSLLESIKDPLTHLIRNCVDHGIESPVEREKSGKAVEGVLTLHAKHESGQFVIEVSDDGAGIDPEKIRNKAIANGLISADSASRAGVNEILQIIFEAGFSTAEQVSSISGRGVGMDVVRNHVERIGGSVQLTSILGQGTKFFIRLPLTLAIVPAVIIRVSEQFFAIPQATFSEVVTVGSNTQVEWIQDLPVCRLRGCLLPLIWLEEVLQCKSEKRSSQRDLFAQDGN